MAATPPLRTVAHTPSTPLHGAKYDDKRNHSTRKSSRQSSSRTHRAIETPPPNPDNLLNTKSSSLRSAYSPPSSTHSSPRNKISRATVSKKKKSSTAMNGDNPNPLSSSHNPSNSTLQQPSLNIAANMLPTPAKTPRKKSVQPAAVNAAARVLFPARPDTVEEAMPTPRKRRNRKSAGFSLYSSMEDDEDPTSENQIQIYTDSKDKIPELDTSEDNPFYERPVEDAGDGTKSKNTKKRKARHSIEGRKEIEEAFKREDGMVYVFRGKKIFRKFPQDSPEPDDDEDPSPSTARPLTRSSIKPRLLFPTPQQRREREEAPNVEDEEATTDIEGPHDHEMTDPDTQPVTTPVKQTSFSTTTPPTTGHATRSSTKKAALDSSPLRAPEPVEALPYDRRGKKVSPFDGWARTKATSVGKGKKREAEAMQPGEGSFVHKKARNDESV